MYRKILIIALNVLFPIITFAQWETESNDNCATANSISSNSSINGNIFKAGSNHNGDVDFFILTTNRGGVVQLKADPNSAISLKLSIKFGGCVSPICYSISVADGLPCYLNVLADAGTYYIQVYDDASNDYDSINNYTLSVTLDTLDPNEFNNSFSTATHLPTDTNFQARIWGNDLQNNCNGDLDYYQFTPTQTGVLQLNIPSVPQPLTFHSHMFDAGSTGDFCKVYTQISGLPLNNLNYLVEAGQSYYWRIQTSSYQMDSGRYSVDVKFDASDSSEFNPDCPRASLLQVNTVYRRKILGKLPKNSCASDIDFYKFVITESGVFRFIIDSVPINLRLQVQEFDQSCVGGTYVTASAQGLCPDTLERIVCAGDVILIKVWDSGNNENNAPYRFRAELNTDDPHECNNIQALASISENCDTTIGTLDPKGGQNADIDYFKFYPRGSSFKIIFTQVPPVTVRYGVKDAGGTTLFTETANGIGLIPPIHPYAFVPGATYYIFVYANDNRGSVLPYKFFVQDSVCSVGIDEMEILLQTSYFQSDDNLIIEVPIQNGFKFNLGIIDALGQKIGEYSLSDKITSIPFAGKNSVYFLTFSTNGTSVSKKMVWIK